MDLSELYTELIAEYSQSKIYRNTLPPPAIKKRGVNPSCGDDITLYLDIRDDIIQKAVYSGSGCAISQASAAMMLELLEGKSVTEARELVEIFLGMIQKSVTEENQLNRLEQALVFQNISNMPARVKCAVLCWHTLYDALKKESDCGK